MNNKTRFIEEDIKFTYKYVRSVIINEKLEPHYNLDKVWFMGVDLTEWCDTEPDMVYELDDLEELVHHSIERFVRNSV